MKRFLYRFPLRLIAESLAIAGLYILSGQITPHISLPHGSGTPLWPPSAIALAVGVAIGYRGAVGVWIGAFFLSHNMLEGPAAGSTALVLATATTLEMLIATLLIRRFVPELCTQLQSSGVAEPSTGRDILRFIGLAGIASLISPSVSAAALRYAGFISEKDIVPVWATLWVSDYAGVLTLTPLLMVILLSWRRRNVFEPIVFPLTTVWLGLSLVAAYIVWQNKGLALDERLRQDSQEIVRQFQGSMERATEQTQAIEGLLIASQNVDSDDFRKFINRLGKEDRSKKIFQWAPRVKLQERKKFEARVRQEDLPEFSIFEWSALHQPVAAESRPEYFPLLFTEPRNADVNELGLDLASIPDILPILDSARDNGRVILALSRGSPTAKSPQSDLFLYKPVYAYHMQEESLTERREHLLGFIRIQLSAPAVLKAVLDAGALQNREVYVFDTTNEDDPVFLTASLPAADQSLPLLSAQKLSQLQATTNRMLPLEFGGKQLLFVVRPGAGY